MAADQVASSSRTSLLIPTDTVGLGMDKHLSNSQLRLAGFRDPQTCVLGQSGCMVATHVVGQNNRMHTAPRLHPPNAIDWTIW